MAHHHIFTLCVGFLTAAFIALNVVSAADQVTAPNPAQAATPQENIQKIEIGSQPNNE